MQTPGESTPKSKLAPTRPTGTRNKRCAQVWFPKHCLCAACCLLTPSQHVQVTLGSSSIASRHAWEYAEHAVAFIGCQLLPQMCMHLCAQDSTSMGSRPALLGKKPVQPDDQMTCLRRASEFINPCVQSRLWGFCQSKFTCPVLSWSSLLVGPLFAASGLKPAPLAEMTIVWTKVKFGVHATLR